MAELEGSGGTHGTSSSISAVVGISAPLNLTGFTDSMERFLGESYESNPALWEFASATTHASQNSPPALLIASQADTTVPYEQSLLMARRAQKLNSICCRVLAISPFGFITCGYTTEPLNFSMGTCSRSSK